MEPTASNRTSQQVRFNKKKTGKEEDFVLDFIGTPRAIKALYQQIALRVKLAEDPAFAYQFLDGRDERRGTPEFYHKAVAVASDTLFGEDNAPLFTPRPQLEVPIKSSATFIFGYADIVFPGGRVSSPPRVLTVDGVEIKAQWVQEHRGILIEVKSERCSVLDLIKQLKSYNEFYREPHQPRALMVFIHLYDLEDRESTALRQNGILPIDGRTLLK